MHIKNKRFVEERDDPTTDASGISFHGSNMADNSREVRIEEQLKVKIGTLTMNILFIMVHNLNAHKSETLKCNLQRRK